jgi:hypothetical protein
MDGAVRPWHLLVSMLCLLVVLAPIVGGIVYATVTKRRKQR